MDPIKKEPTREIIDDFAAEIKANISPGPKPSTAVIFFRNEHENNFERDVVEVPISLLRFRKDNGRIASDVMSYEKDKGPLVEHDKNTQELLKKFLLEKDPEKTTELRQSIRQMGQLQPAIITADGFLINGNRRKVALGMLYEETNNSKWKRMKVVVLPGKNDPGGPPTLREIEQIENRYQLQSEGKSEYTLFDRALSIRRKIEYGVPLEEQLRDDPKYAYLSDKEFKKKVEAFRREFLKPVDAIDRYLEYLDRPNFYSTISEGPGDKEGRWQAFLDYSNTYRLLNDESYRNTHNIKIDSTEIGEVEEVAFKLIRKRALPTVDKVHKVMRNLRKYLTHEDAKEELFEILDIPFMLEEEECYDEDGNEYDERTKDLIWGKKFGPDLIRQVKKAKNSYEKRNDKDTPIRLMDTALKKLDHKDMIPELVPVHDLEDAMKLAESIEKRACELKQVFYRLIKE